MLIFDPENPFPLLTAEESVSYAEAQEHSESVDTWLGLKTHEIEAALVRKRAEGEAGTSNDQQLWIGLPVKTLLTPYTEVRSILEILNLRPGDHVVDLGAGYGRMAFVIERHLPGVRFTGYEFVKERVDEGLRCLKGFRACAETQLKVADLSDPLFHLEQAECYFLYDFGTREAIEKTLADLKAIARSKSIRVIGRGRASRDAIERHHPWLSQVIQARHYGNYSLYESG